MKRDTGLQNKFSKLQLFLYGYFSFGTDLRFVLISTLKTTSFRKIVTAILFWMASFMLFNDHSH